ncbi:MAG: response regulator [Opitutaceae bacterium]|nr:response regulator [Cytophagales bacterium]
MDDKIRILYIDDEEHNLNAFKASFRRMYDIYTAISPEEGKRILQENDIEIIITDQRMPQMTGVEFLESIIEEYPDPMRILLTGYTDIQALIDAVNKGQIYRYMTKPWNEEELKMFVRQAYEVFSLRKENKVLTKSLIQANNQLEFMLRQKLLS